MAALNGISSLTTGAQALSALVAVSPQKQTGYQPTIPAPLVPFTGKSPQPPTLLFHYEAENQVALESDITDHYVEDNTAVQDQIALKPEQVIVHGFIGELTDAPLNSTLQLLRATADRLQAVVFYAPQVSATAQLAYNEAFFAYQIATNAISSAVAAWSSLSNLIGGDDSNIDGLNAIGGAGLGRNFNEATGKVRNNQNKQQTAFQLFYGYWRARTLFTVQTPWAVFKNMAIKSIRAVQDAENSQMTDFELTFKMVRTASSYYQESTEVLQGRAGVQGADETNLGTSSPTESSGLPDMLEEIGAPP